MPSWTQRVVDDLADSKAARLPFNAAWTRAVQEHPPDLRELGIRSGHLDSLFDQDGNDALEWWRGICQRAYVDAPAPGGGPSRLRGLRAALEVELADRPMTTGRVPNRPVAA